MIIGHPQFQQSEKPQPQSPLAPRFQMQNKLRQSAAPSPFINSSFNSCSKSNSSPCFSQCNKYASQQQQHQQQTPPLQHFGQNAPLTQQNFRNQSANLLNCTNNFILNNECNQIYIETGFIECPFHLKRTEWYNNNKNSKN